MDTRLLTVVLGGDLAVRLMGRLAREVEALQEELCSGDGKSEDAIRLTALLADANSELVALSEAVERAKSDGNVIHDPPAGFAGARKS